MPAATRLLGVYHADGGVLGELRHAWGKVARGLHCELCDLTHRGVRRRGDWDDLVRRLPVPFEVVHLNERSPAVAAASGAATPCVLVEVDGMLSPLLGPDDLAPLHGDLPAFEHLLRSRLEAAHLLS